MAYPDNLLGNVFFLPYSDICFACPTLIYVFRYPRFFTTAFLPPPFYHQCYQYVSYKYTDGKRAYQFVSAPFYPSVRFLDRVSRYITSSGRGKNRVVKKPGGKKAGGNKAGVKNGQ